MTRRSIFYCNVSHRSRASKYGSSLTVTAENRVKVQYNGPQTLWAPARVIKHIFAWGRGDPVKKANGEALVPEDKNSNCVGYDLQQADIVEVSNDALLPALCSLRRKCIDAQARTLAVLQLCCTVVSTPAQFLFYTNKCFPAEGFVILELRVITPNGHDLGGALVSSEAFGSLRTNGHGLAIIRNANFMGGETISINVELKNYESVEGLQVTVDDDDGDGVAQVDVTLRVPRAGDYYKQSPLLM